MTDRDSGNREPVLGSKLCQIPGICFAWRGTGRTREGGLVPGVAFGQARERAARFSYASSEDFRFRRRLEGVSLAREMSQSYSMVALVDFGLGDVDLARVHAGEMGRLFGLRYEEVPGSLEYLCPLAVGPWDDGDFL